MLMISTVAATVQTYYKVNYWRKEKVAGDRESVKELVMGIVFDTYWPILGVYPSIVVWFDYKGLSFTPVRDSTWSWTDGSADFCLRQWWRPMESLVFERLKKWMKNCLPIHLEILHHVWFMSPWPNYIFIWLTYSLRIKPGISWPPKDVVESKRWPDCAVNVAVTVAVTVVQWSVKKFIAKQILFSSIQYWLIFFLTMI